MPLVQPTPTIMQALPVAVLLPRIVAVAHAVAAAMVVVIVAALLAVVAEATVAEVLPAVVAAVEAVAPPAVRLRTQRKCNEDTMRIQ